MTLPRPVSGATSSGFLPDTCTSCAPDTAHQFWQPKWALSAPVLDQVSGHFRLLLCDKTVVPPLVF
jgi:hypothetical protein